MRLIARKVYRAFPELDEFEDAQCRRFVAAANAAWWKVALRAAAVFLVGATLTPLGILGGVMIGQSSAQQLRASDGVATALSAVTMTALIAAGWTLALLTRDVLLRLGVRRVILRCGLCWNCRYSLLGMPVGSDCRITCPECGRVTTADPSLGELAREGDADVYRPTAHRDDAAAIEARRIRRRGMLRWAARAASLLAIVLLIVYGLLWLQALRARSIVAGTVTLVENARRSLRDPSISDVEARRRWDRLIELTADLERHVTGSAAGLKNPGRGRLHADTLDAGMTDEEFSSRWRLSPAHRKDMAAFAGAIVTHARASGVIDRLSEIESLVGATQPVGSQDLWGFEGLTNLHNARALLIAELQVAMNESDLPAYTRAARGLIALQTILTQQGFDPLWYSRDLHQAIGSHLRRYPDAAWLDAVADLLPTPPCDDPTLAARYALSGVALRSSLAAPFTDPHMPLKLAVGYTGDLPQEYTYWLSIRRPGPKWSGTLAANLAVGDALNDAGLVAEASPPGKRPLPATPTTPMLAAAQLQWYTAMLPQRWTQLASMQRAWLALRVERFRLRNGRLPVSLAEVLGPNAPARWTIDEVTGNALVIVPLPPGPDGNLPRPPFEIRGSSTIGGNGADPDPSRPAAPTLAP